MKLAIIGSRSFNDFEMMLKFINYHFNLRDITEIISGGANGADSLAKRIATEVLQCEYTEFPAEWENLSEPCLTVIRKDGTRYNALAGHNRNTKIIEACDAVLCFHDGISKGTLNSLNKARKLKKNTVIIYF